MTSRITLSAVLDDLASRFIINVPEEESQAIERICFQIEQAHWFYEDFTRKSHPYLPSMSPKNFAAQMFQHCPLLSQWGPNPDIAYKRFLEYKFQVPVLLVKGWNSRSSWGFPRGKINKDEPEWECAQREVFEETGFNILPYMNKDDWLEMMVSNQKIRLYYIPNIPESTEFKPMTRGEISGIEWHSIDVLPSYSKSNKPRQAGEGKYYMIKPFV
ncbi:mRNA-decapping enzyme subunit 2, partial [Spiromyces aspiralis]